MTSNLDLTLIPLSRQDGRERNGWTGLHSAMAPRRAAHGRRLDNLVLGLHMEGSASFSPDQYQQLLSGLEKTYYGASGSVTTALRATAETLNTFLLDRNLRGASRGQQALGVLAMLVARQGRLYVGLCGPGHVFLHDGKESQHIHDPQLSGRGLGVSRNTAIYFFQADLSAGGWALITPNPPATWGAAILEGGTTQTTEALRRRVLGRAGNDFQGALIQVQPGQGIVQVLTAGSEPPPAPAAQTEHPPLMRPPRLPDSGQVVPADESLPIESHPLPEPTAGLVEATKTPIPAEREPDLPTQAAEPETEKPRRRDRLDLAAEVRTRARQVAAWWRQVTGGVNTAVGKFIPPGLADIGLPDRAMAFIAVAVPVVVVTFAVVIYSRPGRTALYQQAYDQAYSLAQQTAGFSDPNDQRAGWETILWHFDEAESYLVTAESQELRRQVRAAWDILEHIQRVDLQPAIIGGLGAGVLVTRIVTIGTDIYLLNANQGNVLRLHRAGGDYERDPDFQCGPGTPGSTVGPLVDILLLAQIGADTPALLGVDSDGTLLYCSPDGIPVAAVLSAPPGGWGRIAAMEVDSSVLYIVDPESNNVWIYPGFNNAFNEAPVSLFASMEPLPVINNVVDLAVHNKTIYLLHADGTLTTCVFSDLEGALAVCNALASYKDERPGRMNAPQVAEAQFEQLQYNSLSGPALYFLDAGFQAVYRINLALKIDIQYRPLTPLTSGPATAFALNTNRVFFIAVGNELFFGDLP